jgi:hypothetical protein
MRAPFTLWLALVWLAPAGALAQDAYKMEVLKEAPPAALPAAIKGTLQDEGFRVVSSAGKTVADIWLRKATPATAKPSGPKGPICFPVLSEGELLGALRFSGDGHDYRDQPIPAGVYTLRYGLQPVNGDHLGVSTFRDFALLIAAAKDKAPADIPEKKLEDQSAETAGSSHPAVLMIVPAPTDAKPGVMVHDETKDTWGAVVPLVLQVKGESAPASLSIQLVLVGVAMN